MNPTNINNTTNTTFPKWFALYTKPQHEKFVESALTEKNIESFTPTVLLKKKWSDRVKLIEQPFFKGYCFAKFPIKDKILIVSQRGVVNIVNFRNKYIFIQDSVIDSLKILVENKIKIDPYPFLKTGDRIRVKRGPLKNIEGYIIEKRSKSSISLVISIEAIASSVRCVIDAADVESA